MRLDTESMPLLAYDQLRVEKLIVDEVRAECYDEAMTGEFSQFEDKSVLLAHDQLMVEKPIEGEVKVKYFNSSEKEVLSDCKDSSDQIPNSVFSLVAGSARVQVNLLADPVLHGWTKTLRIINYLLALPKQLKPKRHLIPDKNCLVCELGDNPWNPTRSEKVAEKSLFRYETRVINGLYETRTNTRISGG